MLLDGGLHHSKKILHLVAIMFSIGGLKWERYDKAFDGADEIGGSGSAHPIEKIVEIRVGDM